MRFPGSSWGNRTRSRFAAAGAMTTAWRFLVVPSSTRSWLSSDALIVPATRPMLAQILSATSRRPGASRITTGSSGRSSVAATGRPRQAALRGVSASRRSPASVATTRMCGLMSSSVPVTVRNGAAPPAPRPAAHRWCAGRVSLPPGLAKTAARKRWRRATLAAACAPAQRPQHSGPAGRPCMCPSPSQSYCVRLLTLRNQPGARQAVWPFLPQWSRIYVVRGDCRGMPPFAIRTRRQERCIERVAAVVKGPWCGYRCLVSVGGERVAVVKPRMAPPAKSRASVTM